MEVNEIETRKKKRINEKKNRIFKKISKIDKTLAMGEKRQMTQIKLEMKKK